MATDRDEQDPSIGEVIDLTRDDEYDAEPAIDPELRTWTVPTPEAVHFKSTSDYVKV
jgi:hypothetical protein